MTALADGPTLTPALSRLGGDGWPGANDNFRIVPSIGNTDLHHDRLHDAYHLCRRHADQKAAPAAVDVDSFELDDGFFHVHRHRLSQAERRAAADEIA